ncbi:MAG: hypothetical protein GY716_00900 [bacterium]|nr:hypothetical protein [bacterium]
MKQQIRALAPLLIGALSILAPTAHAAVTSWTNPSGGDWFNPANWSAGVPGQQDDAIIDRPGSYTVDLVGGAANVASLTLAAPDATLLNEGFLTVNGTLDVGGGTLDGNGSVVVNGLLRFTRGSIGGSGTLEVNGDMAFSAPTTKTISGRSVTTFGNVSWTDGNISTTSGISWHQADGTLVVNSDATWSDDGTGTLVFDAALHVTGDGSLPPFHGGPTQVMAIDSGKLLRVNGGGTLDGSIVTLGSLAPANGLFSFRPSSSLTGSGEVVVGSGAEVRLDTDVSMTGGSWTVDGGSLTVWSGRRFLPGSDLRVTDGDLRFASGSSGAATQVPTLELSGGNVRVDGTLVVNTSLDQSFGTLWVLGELTAAGAHKSGGYTSTEAGGTLVIGGIFDLSGGTLATAAAAGSPYAGTLAPGVVLLDSVIQTGGALDGIGGTIDVGGTYSWRAGAWDGGGTLVIQDLLTIEGSSQKTLGDRRVVTSGGVDWIDGDVVGSGGFVWKQLQGPFAMSNTDGNWTGTGTLVVLGELSTVSGGSIAVDPVLRIASLGTLDVRGLSRLSLGSLTLDGDLRVNGDLSVRGADLVCGSPGGGLPGCESSTFVSDGTLVVFNGLTHDYSDARAWSFSPGSRLRIAGGVLADVDDWPRWTALEIAGEDLGPGQQGVPNFDVSELSIAPGARLLLEDRVDNLGLGAAEALYVDTLTFDDADGRINLNGRRLYYNQLFGNPAQIVDEPVIHVGLSKNDAQGAVNLVWSTNGFPPFRVLRSAFADAGFSAITPQGGTNQSAWDDGVLFDGQTYYYLVEREVP